MTLDVRIFGAPVIRLDGDEVRIRGAVPRALVCRLALSAGETVGLSALAEEIWSKPPRTAAGTLRAHFSRLRAGPLGESLLGGHGGYSFQVEPDRVDALRYRRLVADGIASRNTGDAGSWLTAAEELWGTPLVGVDAPFADRERAGLNRLREQALERLSSLSLEGDVEVPIATLEQFHQAYPANEEATAGLATALSRLGRTRDALAVVAGFATDLREHSGLDPSPRLEALTQSILRRDPDVVMAHGPSIVRHHVPHPATALVGRASELEQLEAVRVSTRLTTITGPGGIGKTRLAVESLWRSTRTIDEEQWLVDLTAAVSDAEVVSVIAEAIGATEPSMTAIARRLDGTKGLLLLDNAEHVLDEVARAVGQILGATAGLAIMITSREPLRIPGEAVFGVGELPDEDAVALFSARAGNARAPREYVPAEDVLAIVRGLERIPLAIELAASQLEIVGVDELRTEIERSGGLIGDRDTRQGSVEASIAWSYALLSAPEQRLLQQLSRFAGSFTLDGVEEICGDEPHTRNLTARLIRRSLIATLHGEAGERRYRLLESVRRFAALRDSGTEAERMRWRKRHRIWHSRLAYSRDAELLGETARAAHAWLAGSRADLAMAFEDALDEGDRESALRLAAGQAWHWFLRSTLHDGIRELERAFAVPGTAEPRVEMQARLAAALLMQRAGTPAESAPLVHEARALALAHDSVAYRAIADTRAAVVAHAAGDIVAAEQAIAAALADIDSVPQWAAAEMLTTEAAIAWADDRPAEALAIAERAVEAAEGGGHDWGRSASLLLTAQILIQSRRGPDALDALVRGAKISHDERDPIGVLSAFAHAARASALVEQHADGARLLAIVDTIGPRYDYVPRETEPLADAARRRAVRAALTSSEWSSAYADGRTLRISDGMRILARLTEPTR